MLWDCNENYNILKKDYYDKNRRSRVQYDELFFYPFSEEAMEKGAFFRNEMRTIWKSAGWLYEHYGVARKKIGLIKKYYMKATKKIP